MSAKYPGRPRLYDGETRKLMVSLLRKHKSVIQVYEMLNVRNSPVGLTKRQRELLSDRKEEGIKEPIKVSRQTLVNIAKEANIKLRKGPRGPRSLYNVESTIK